MGRAWKLVVDSIIDVRHKKRGGFIKCEFGKKKEINKRGDGGDVVEWAEG